jgi:hypothetical protein
MASNRRWRATTLSLAVIHFLPYCRPLVCQLKRLKRKGEQRIRGRSLT